MAYRKSRKSPKVLSLAKNRMSKSLNLRCVSDVRLFFQTTDSLKPVLCHFGLLPSMMRLTAGPNRKMASIPHLSLASRKRDIGKQSRPRSDATELDVCAVSTLFALNTGISVTHGNNKNLPSRHPLYWKWTGPKKDGRGSHSV